LGFLIIGILPPFCCSQRYRRFAYFGNFLEKVDMCRLVALSKY
jgi:hypothetical protein